MGRLYRSKTNRVFAGVCGGLGDYLTIDAAFIRLLMIVLVPLTAFFPIIIAYFICWMIIPEAPRGFVAPNYKKLFKSAKNRRISGLCGGIGEYFKIDPTLIRVLFVLAMILTAFFPMLIAYFIGSLIIKDKPSKHHPIEVEVDID